ncbi:HAD-IIA family hydrolase [Xanthobacter sp. DSM 24535]|uniref:HAD-IIA family hydrolase n=1 Tax=Roseixanthobacter psychrophilus TaxID=3119917 RepID=UPI003726A82C
MQDSQRDIGPDVVGRDADIDGLQAARTALAQARGLLIDLDGTLMHAHRVLPGARDLIRRHGRRSMVLSNNSSDTCATLSQRLRVAGMEIPAGRIILAGVETIALTARRWPGARVLLCAAPVLQAAAAEAGLCLTRERAEVVIIARDEQFDYAALSAAANAVSRGAAFVVTNPDGAHPGPGRLRVPETGALAAAVAAAAGRQPDLVVGKPSPGLFQTALAKLGLTADQALMIGDNPATDGRGASALGMPACILDDTLTLPRLLAA